jgi:hypothetical protein
MPKNKVAKYVKNLGEMTDNPATFSSWPGLMSVDTNPISASKVNAILALFRPENYLLVLFALSTTLWTIAFLAYYLSSRMAGSVASLFRGARCFQSPRLATLLVDGSPTTRPTLPR